MKDLYATSTAQTYYTMTKYSSLFGMGWKRIWNCHGFCKPRFTELHILQGRLPFYFGCSPQKKTHFMVSYIFVLAHGFLGFHTLLTWISWLPYAPLDQSSLHLATIQCLPLLRHFFDDVDEANGIASFVSIEVVFDEK